LNGRSNIQASGITCDSIILCKSLIEIGAGTIISWGCFFSDSSQHEINGLLKIKPISIGNHVWIGEHVTCAPGARIGDGSVVACKSFVNKGFPPFVLLAGTPAKIIKENIDWRR
jgi:acetyltransferase-like isoleucine patch superfamily enzyme